MCRAALRSHRNRMLRGALFGVGVFFFFTRRADVLSCEHTSVQVTSATAFDSQPLFSNQKRVSVWVSLKACPEIGSISLYTHQTGTVCNLTGSRSSYPSSMAWATRVCVSECVWRVRTSVLLCAVYITACNISALGKHYSLECHSVCKCLMWPDSNVYSLCMTSFTLQTY